MFYSALFLIALIAGLILPGEAAYTGAYIAMGAALLAILLNGWRQRSAFLELPSLAILVAIVVLSVGLAFVYKGEADLLAPVFLLPMLTAPGLAMLARKDASLPGPAVFSVLAMLGAAIAFAGGAYEVYYLHVTRAGLAGNPIHYASIAVMVGGLSMIGAVSGKSRWRFIFLLGPLLGLGAAVMSGSRGPLAGAIGIALVGLAYIVIVNWQDRWLRRAVFLSGLIVLSLAAYLMTSDFGRVSRLFDTAFDIFRFTGSSDDIRAAMYASALHILQEKPLTGVGYGQMVGVAQELYPKLIGNFDNLHADWANFAAMAGVPGLVAWLLVLLSPLMLLADPVARRDQPIVLGALLLVTGQSVLGVSNAMFGVLPQTVVFAVGLGFLMARLRQLRWRATST